MTTPVVQNNKSQLDLTLPTRPTKTSHLFILLCQAPDDLLVKCNPLKGDSWYCNWCLSNWFMVYYHIKIVSLPHKNKFGFSTDFLILSTHFCCWGKLYLIFCAYFNRSSLSINILCSQCKVSVETILWYLL